MFKLPLILASSSPARLDLLNSINITPDFVLPADIDEAEHPKELPRESAFRLAYEKAMATSNKVECGIIIAADTIVATGRSTLPKALTIDDVKFCLNKLSGRRHRIFTGLCIIHKDQDNIKISRKVVQTTLKFKRLSAKEIESYANSKEGIGKAGGYSIRGYAESFIELISGSYSNVVGLPLTETLKVLEPFRR
jgi:septum formation protein